MIKVEIDKCPLNSIPVLTGAAAEASITANVVGPSTGGWFKFTLTNVSDEPGYCMNSHVSVPSTGSLDATDWKDLQFKAGQTGYVITNSNSVAQTLAINLTGTTVVVKSNDYGAYGRIKVEFVTTMVRGASPIITGVETGGTKLYTNIPLDDNENHIADSAAQDSGPGTGSGAEDDTDNTLQATARLETDSHDIRSIAVS